MIEAPDDALTRGLFESSPQPQLVLEDDGRVVLANEEARRMLGYEAPALVGQDIEILLPERVRTQCARQRGRGAIGDVIVGLRSVRRRDASEVPVEIRLSALEGPTGRLFIAALCDASERVEQERTLREAEERFRLALDEAPIGMALVGLDGRFLRVNRALCEIVGYEREELEKRTFQEITHPDDLDIDLALAEQLFRGEIPRHQLSKRYIRKDGTVADVMLSGSVVRRGDGEPLYGIAQVEDITERRRAEEALRRSEIRFRELFAQLSDGVFIADLAGRYTDVNAAACRMLGYAREELVGKTIMDLIPREDVPRLAASREQLLRPEHVHRAEWLAIARECAAAVAPQAAPRPIQLETREPELRGDVDPDRIAQVIENLLTNAVKYGAPGTPVGVALRRLGDGAQVAVVNEQTMADIGIWVRHFQVQLGMVALTPEILDWAQRYLRGGLIRLSALQFELRPFGSAAWVFGSMSRGDASSRSHLDVAVPLSHDGDASAPSACTRCSPDLPPDARSALPAGLQRHRSLRADARAPAEQMARAAAGAGRRQACAPLTIVTRRSDSERADLSASHGHGAPRAHRCRARRRGSRPRCCRPRSSASCRGRSSRRCARRARAGCRLAR